jgi:ketosteroid isomerase-like protein
LLPTPDTDLATRFQDDALFESTSEPLAPLFDPEFESTAMWQLGTTYRGRDGLRQLWLDWLEPWETYYSHTEELVDAGEQVIVLSRSRGRRRDTKAEVEIVTGTVWEIPDGRVVRIDFDRERAFAAVGRTANESIN